MTPNGEVEGPDDHARQGPRAHTFSRDPRPQTDHASRTPPTIVRPPAHLTLDASRYLRRFSTISSRICRRPYKGSEQDTPEVPHLQREWDTDEDT